MRRLKSMLLMSLAVARTLIFLPTSMLKRLALASTSRARTCMSDTSPAHAAPIRSVILKTFLPPLLAMKYPYETRFSEARMMPSWNATPIVVAPGIQAIPPC